MALPRVFVFGAGNLGSGLTRAMRAAGYRVTLRAHRSGLPAERIDADLVVLAIHDRQIESLTHELSRLALIGHRTVALVHCSGRLGPEVLFAARGPTVAVAQMHPMISFAKQTFTPGLSRGQLLIDGDPDAARMAKAVGRRLGMTPRTIPGLDKVAYHASAAILVAGTSALVAAGVEILGQAGVSAKMATEMLGPFLRSVAENVERLGLPDAVTGPVRRGDVEGLRVHFETLARVAPEVLPIYVAVVKMQLPFARVLGNASEKDFIAIEELMCNTRAQLPKTRKP